MSDNVTKVVGISIAVDGADQVQSAITEVKALNDNIQKTGKGDISTPVKGLRSELREARLEAEKLLLENKQNTQEYVNALKRVTELKNASDELQNSIKAADIDNKTAAFAGMARAGVGAMQLVTGSMAVFGAESENAQVIIAKLQGVMAFSEGLNGLLDLQDSWKDITKLLGLATLETTENTTAQIANGAAQTGTATAIGGVDTATKTATLSTKAFGLALKAIGIGLLVAGLVALWENYDIIKQKIDRLLPNLGGVDNLISKITNSVYGLGEVASNTFSNLGKAVTNLLAGNFKAMSENLKQAGKFSESFNKGVNDKLKSDAEEAKRVRLQADIEANEMIISQRKALGENTYNLEVANAKRRIQVLDKESKDYASNLAKAQSDLTVLINSETKRRQDLAKQASDKQIETLRATLEQERKLIQDHNKEALKLIKNASMSERDIELKSLNDKYQIELDLLEKRKGAIKDYHTVKNNLIQAQKIEESNINKKYDDQINDYLKGIQNNTLSSYESAINEIDKVISEKIKNATPEQIALLNSARDSQVNKLRGLESADINSKKANINLTNTENENQINEGDSPETILAKTQAITDAKLSAENMAFELQRLQLEGQNLELEQLNADHQSKLTQIEQENKDARLAIAEAEKNGKTELLNQIGQALGVAGEIAGESTAAGKALSVASASISTYQAAQQAYASQFLPVPTLSSPLRGSLAAGVAVASGLANVKKILSVKVPGASGGSGSVGGGMPSAPVINSTIIQRDATGNNEVVDAITKKNNQPLEAYITQKSLNRNQERQNIENNLSSY